jgi:hypothetical protein
MPCSKSREDFVAHHKKKYGMTRPPIWAACEGHVVWHPQPILQQHPQRCRPQAHRRSISPGRRGLLFRAASHGLVRNICAHHARLWNRQFTITIKIPYNPDVVAKSVVRFEPQTRYIYNTLVLLAYLMDITRPSKTLGAEESGNWFTIRSSRSHLTWGSLTAGTNFQSGKTACHRWPETGRNLDRSSTPLKVSLPSPPSLYPSAFPPHSLHHPPSEISRKNAWACSLPISLR